MARSRYFRPAHHQGNLLIQSDLAGQMRLAGGSLVYQFLMYAGYREAHSAEDPHTFINAVEALEKMAFVPLKKKGYFSPAQRAATLAAIEANKVLIPIMLRPMGQGQPYQRQLALAVLTAKTKLSAIMAFLEDFFDTKFFYEMDSGMTTLGEPRTHTTMEHGPGETSLWESKQEGREQEGRED